MPMTMVMPMFMRVITVVMVPMIMVVMAMVVMIVAMVGQRIFMSMRVAGVGGKGVSVGGANGHTAQRKR